MLYVHYLQELKMVESEHCVEEVINEDNEVNRNKFMQILGCIHSLYWTTGLSYFPILDKFDCLF